LQEWRRNGAGMRNEDKLTTKSIKSFASSLVNKRVALNTLRELLGHSSEEMVLKYAHIHDQTKAGAEALLTT